MMNRTSALTLLLIVLCGSGGRLPAQDTPPTTGTLPDPSGMPVDQALDLARLAIDQLESSDDPAVREQAGQDLDRGLAIVKTNAPDHPWLPYLYAFASLRLGQSWDAVDHLRAFVRTRDGRTEWKAYRSLGDLVVDEFPRLARSHFDKAASLIDGEPSVLYGLSRCAANVGEYAEALEFAKQTVAADRRQSTKYLRHLARIARLQKNWAVAQRAGQDSLALARQAVSARPGDRVALIEVNAQYKLLMDIETARLADLRDPSEIAAGFATLANFARDRAKVVGMLSKHEVVSILETGEKRLGDDVPVSLLEELIVAYYDIGRDQLVIDTCRRVLATDSHNAVALEWLARFGEHIDDGEDHDHDGDGIPDH